MTEQVSLGRNGITLFVDGNTITFDDHGSQFGLAENEIMDLFKWMQKNITINQVVKEELVIQPVTEILVRANRSGPKPDLRDNVSNIFQGR